MLIIIQMMDLYQFRAVYEKKKFDLKQNLMIMEQIQFEHLSQIDNQNMGICTSQSARRTKQQKMVISQQQEQGRQLDTVQVDNDLLINPQPHQLDDILLNEQPIIVHMQESDESQYQIQQQEEQTDVIMELSEVPQFMLMKKKLFVADPDEIKRLEMEEETGRQAYTQRLIERERIREQQALEQQQAERRRKQQADQQQQAVRLRQQEEEQKQMMTRIAQQQNAPELQPQHINDIQPSEKRQALLGISQMFEGSGLGFRIASESNPSNESNLDFLPILTSSIQKSTVFEVRLSDDQGDKYHFDELQIDGGKMKEFKTNMIRLIAAQLGKSEDEIIIMNVSQGSITIEIFIRNVNEDNRRNYPDRIQQIRMPNRLLNLSEKPVTFIIHPADFNKNGNFEFSDGYIKTRGQMPYYQPSAPWKRLGLNILQRFPNDGWLDMDGNKNEWAVAFHGVRRDPPAALAGIRVNHFGIGPMQAYESEAGRGVYCAPRIETAEGYCRPIVIDGKRYHYVFQCRVKPDRIRQVNNGQYWVINDPAHIRPYGICLKEL